MTYNSYVRPREQNPARIEELVAEIEKWLTQLADPKMAALASHPARKQSVYGCADQVVDHLGACGTLTREVEAMLWERSREMIEAIVANWKAVR